MSFCINTFADVIAGYTFRGAINPNVAGDLLVFQAKDLVRGTSFSNVSGLTKISQDGLNYTGYLEQNDVLLVARGMKPGAFRSTVFDASDQNVIASSSILVIRIKTKDILPYFLSLYLNSKEGQNALSEIISGSYIGALPRKALEKIKVPVPSVQKQQTLIQLYQNIQEQQKIFIRQNEIKQNIFNATFENLAQE